MCKVKLRTSSAMEDCGIKLLLNRLTKRELNSIQKILGLVSFINIYSNILLAKETRMVASPYLLNIKMSHHLIPDPLTNFLPLQILFLISLSFSICSSKRPGYVVAATTTCQLSDGKKRDENKIVKV